MEKIAILGGGAGALSAAFHLTERDPEGRRYDITVYQVGWRLGGKGAVGRDPQRHNRVEEHGLHVWTGFYDHAFDLVDRLYEALRCSARPVPFGSRFAAFKPLDCATLMQRKDDGGWTPWRFELPRRDGTPGVDGSPAAPTLTDHVRNLVASSQHRLGISLFEESQPLKEKLQAATAYADKLPRDPAAVSPQMLEELRKRIGDAHDALQKAMPASKTDSALRSAAGDPERERVLIELALAMAKGLAVHEVFSGDFTALEDKDWSEWMASNGCSQASLDSAVVRACYDYVFGYVDGKRNVAAGTATNMLLKLLFGYKEAFFYVMRATMGELLFAPLYTVLRARGVKFRFFHRVDQLRLGADRQQVDAIDVTVQATPHGDYDPLITIPDGAGGTLQSWPCHPKYECLHEGDALQAGGHDLESAWSPWPGTGSKTLRRGVDFDRVVLGIGLGAFPWICKDLVDKIQRWEDMVKHVRTTPTMALQLWTTCPTRSLVQPVDDPTILSAFGKPLDSWGDLSLMLAQETWPDPRPHGLHYFVGAYQPQDGIPAPGRAHDDFPATQLQAVQRLQRDWVDSDLRKLWPGLADGDGGIRWDMLFDADGATGEDRLKAQYARVNLNPSDQYVQSVAGSSRYRMAAGDSGVANLYLAGDWVKTEINAGCVEAAVSAGRAAVAAITGLENDMPNDHDSHGSGFANILLPGLTLLRKLEQRASGGTGVIDGYCTIVSVPTREVASQLPPGVVLATPTAHTQRVVLVFARQRDVRPGLMPFGGLRYCEVFQIIPGVQMEEAPSARAPVFSFMPNLLLDNLLPVVVGQNVYGFNKHLAQIRHGDAGFDVRSKFGATTAQFEPEGLPGGIDDFEEIAKLRERLQFPLLGLAADGSFVVSSVHFDLDAGTFQRIGGTIRTGKAFLPQDAELQLGPKDSDAAWGFRMQCPWRLSLPAGDLGRLRTADHHGHRLVAHYRDAVVGKIPVRR